MRYGVVQQLDPVVVQTTAEMAAARREADLLFSRHKARAGLRVGVTAARANSSDDNFVAAALALVAEVLPQGIYLAAQRLAIKMHIAGVHDKIAPRFYPLDFRV